MHFAFTEEQTQFGDVVADVLATFATPEIVRAAWTAPPGELDRHLWDQLVELGLASALVAESDAGLGLDECDVALAFEHAGYHAAPGPLIDSILVAPTLGGSADAGALMATNFGGDLVSCAADADRLLLFDRVRSTVSAYLPDEVRLGSLGSVDGARRLSSVMPIGPGTLLTDDADRIEQAELRGVFGASAMLIGLTQRMLDMTVGYVCERRQFGVPIGSFQAIKHHCADALTALAFARPAVHRAGWSLAAMTPDRHRDVSVAKVVASDAATRVGRLALQCHGAIAYTVEYDLHLYLKRAEALAAAWGGTASHRSVVAEALSIR